MPFDGAMNSPLSTSDLSAFVIQLKCHHRRSIHPWAVTGSTACSDSGQVLWWKITSGQVLRLVAVEEGAKCYLIVNHQGRTVKVQDLASLHVGKQARYGFSRLPDHLRYLLVG